MIRRAAFLGAVALALAGCAVAPPETAQRIAFVSDAQTPPPDGALTFLSGFHWRSENPDFGGVSGLALTKDGAGLLAVTDKGRWLRATLAHDAQGRLVGVGAPRLSPLPGPDGAALSGKRDADAEALAPAPGGGWLVAFERRHRILRYPADKEAFPKTAEPFAPQPDFSGLRRNSGPEAMAVDAAGRVIVLAEDSADGEEDGPLPGWIIDEGAVARFSLTRAGLFKPTDATLSPDGASLYLLERRFTRAGGPAMRIRRIAVADIAPGATLSGDVLIEADARYAVDNMEGIAARRGPDGATLIYVISDDNFNPLQRTLLLQFRLAP